MCLFDSKYTSFLLCNLLYWARRHKSTWTLDPDMWLLSHPPKPVPRLGSTSRKQIQQSIHPCAGLRVCSNTVESQFQVYRTISVHAQEVCRSVSSNPDCRLNYSVLRCWSRCAPEAHDRQTVSLPHTKTFLARSRAGTMRSNVCARSVLSELRSFFSLYDNLFTVPCCACGDLL